MLEDADRDRPRVADAKEEKASEMAAGIPDLADGLVCDDAEVDEASEVLEVISRLEIRRESARGVGDEKSVLVAVDGLLSWDGVVETATTSRAARVSPDTVPRRVKRARFEGARIGAGCVRSPPAGFEVELWRSNGVKVQPSHSFCSKGQAASDRWPALLRRQEG